MKREEFDTYLSHFNGRDYDGVLSHFNESPVITFADVRLESRDAIRSFYGFFHDHVSETINVRSFLSDDEHVMIEAVVRLEGRKPLTQDALEREGYPSLVSLDEGDVVEIPQFIHYRLTDGRFDSAVCAIAAFA